MDASELILLVDRAIGEGLCDEDAATGIDESAVTDVGRTRVAGLLGTYRRRLKLTESGTDLRDQTEDLVRFLEGRGDEYLATIRVHLSNGLDRVFLSESDEPRILFWMKMLDLPTYVQR
ncbi:hypothetical protein [Nocardia sp. IFM 10818]